MHCTCVLSFLLILLLGINIEVKMFKGVYGAETQVLVSERDLGKLLHVSMPFLFRL